MIKEIGKIILMIFSFGLSKFFTRRKKPDLKKHTVFNRLKYYIDFKIPDLPIEHPVKKKHMVNLLTIKYKILESTIKSSLCDKDLDAKEIDYAPVLMEAIKSYELEAHKQKIPLILVERFSEWHESKVRTMLDSIEVIKNSTFYKSSYEKKLAILDITMWSLIMTITDAEKTLNELNGELEKALQELNGSSLARV